MRLLNTSKATRLTERLQKIIESILFLNFRALLSVPDPEKSARKDISKYLEGLEMSGKIIAPWAVSVSHYLKFANKNTAVGTEMATAIATISLPSRQSIVVRVDINL